MDVVQTKTKEHVKYTVQHDFINSYIIIIKRTKKENKIDNSLKTFETCILLKPLQLRTLHNRQPILHLVRRLDYLSSPHKQLQHEGRGLQNGRTITLS